MRLRRILIPLSISVFTLLTASAQDLPNPPTAVKKQDVVKGPRAVAVLEWTNKGPRLIPVAIKIDDQFYDASLYMAQPVPMAIESGVIYQIQRAGDSLGDFTLREAAQTANGLWLGMGSFDSKADQDKRKAAVAKRVEREAKQKADEEKQELGDRPVLKRATPKDSAPPPETTSSDKPSSTTSQTPASTSTPVSTQAPPPPPKPQVTETSSDPNRPILRRGKPAEEQAASINEKIGEKKPVPPPPGMARMEVAVSDATPSQPHSYKWDWANPTEEQSVKAQAQKLALATLADYAKRTNGPKPGAVQDVTIEAYDLSYSNAATVILSARVLSESKPAPVHYGARSTKAAAPAEPSEVTPAFEYYVTIVGREDIYGQLQKKLAVATDNKHLDAFPRLQLVGVVDADGNGSGDLLFQSTNDRSESFVIYRDTGWELEQLIQVPEPKV
jgi:hypothetical protein